MAYAVPKDYTWELKIASYDAGRDRRLRPSNQLKLQQEVGELHLGIGGLDYDAFYQHGIVFVPVSYTQLDVEQVLSGEAFEEPETGDPS